MSQPHLVERERRLLHELVRVATERAEAEESTARAFHVAQNKVKTDFAETTAQIEARFRGSLAAADRELAATRQTLAARHGADSQAIEQECHAAVERMILKIETAERRAQQELNEARWLARTVYDASRKRLKQQIREAQKQLRVRRTAARSIEQAAADLMAGWGMAKLVDLAAIEEHTTVAEGNVSESLATALKDAESRLGLLRALRLPKLTHGGNLIWIFIAVAMVVVPAFGWLAGWRPVAWLVPSAVVILSAGTAASLWLRTRARRRAGEDYRTLVESARRAEACCRTAMRQSLAAYEQKRREIKSKRNEEYRAAAEAQEPTLAKCRGRREIDLPKLTTEADARLVARQRQFDEDGQRAVDRHVQQIADIRQNHEQSLSAVQGVHKQTLEANQARYDANRTGYLNRWERGFAAAQAELAIIADKSAASCPDWDVLLSDKWKPAETMPEAIRFGQLSLDLRQRLGPDAARKLAADPAQLQFALPASLAFPEGTSLYVKAQDAGRRTAIELLQTVMLRMLSSVPPGKVRFTIVDPVGLGQNFAAFMHLADHDEALVGNRIWTEPAQIEQRLADLTEHMETVIQKYLRDEFPTIEAYNEAAGEVAEPFRVLVVANFPASFTEAAARRLLSIAASGPRCGVHLLLTVDSRLPALPGIRLADLQQHATVFTATNDQLAWQDADFKDIPLSVEAPPLEQCKPLLHRIGAAAVRAKRVEVPFDAIAPEPDRYWTSDSRHGIDVPLGRAGATRLQHLRLGHGTSQHVLIAGKTGSGKSTLLHALVTNAALRYSPDDLELYLVDFKKGVEFKTYVTHQLPHARVVAIESEREFGLSVMQRLDTEMRIRGDRFREVGVQDIAGYREHHGKLPRILFIVDEFQEFFVHDDKLAQEASLLLDRLVRQGRAFGIHVHLGSQTLGGAYTLARSTLGQMAVRIALQCSEADAHLILSEDNSAARLLSRPGDAIYNDANGLVEGNHPFQVVWLPDDRREVYLREVAQLAVERPLVRRPSQIVFEGAQPADIEKNATLAELFDSQVQPSAVTAPRVWLGEPLAIEEATSATFPRRGGANLLWLGQNDTAVAGMLTAAVLSLAAQSLPPGDDSASDLPQCVILNGGSTDRDHGGTFRQLASLLPGKIRLAPAGETAAVMAELAAEVSRRQASSGDAAPVFLLVFDLPRLRELRRQEDDFSFSRGAEPERPRPDRQFAEILRDGPSVGVHVLAWCDTLTSFNRMLDRQALKEFETRVLLQMSAADSSMLVDTPAASQLGRHRAYLHCEDEGRLEKFRPFSIPSTEWLERICQRISQRAIVGAPSAVTAEPAQEALDRS
ncbi:MAG: cell division protein FtsK [Planctomycetia bacterium]|nr:cell division protein FtsK [Planctomycetia bacterium]